ncbi:MAG: cysteine desulfurase [Gemmataceae bacterium]|nr:cysteine desulfurase [Gemmataceae bacterium]
MDIINLDHNATTPVAPEVWEAMRPWAVDQPGNAASSHALGRRARRALEDAREEVAALLGAAADEVVFTSGATEANNLAIFGLVGPPPGVLAGSGIEHPCVAEPLAELVRRGYRSLTLPVSREGIVGPPSDGWPSDTRLACVMLANHETGAVQPVQELARSLPAGATFHCDAAAAAGKLPIAFHDLGVTSLTISAHKFRGPQGIGALLVRKPARLRPLLYGGHQQQGRRPGTEAVALAVGMAVALRLSLRQREETWLRWSNLRERLLSHLQREAAPIVVNGPSSGGLPQTINVSFPGCRSELLLMQLDLAGLACSTGSACSSGSLLPSPVLKAMGVGDDVLASAMRFSLGSTTTAEEIDEAARRIVKAVHRLRHGNTSGAGNAR